MKKEDWLRPNGPTNFPAADTALEKTIEIVKEKAWTLTDAWKSMAKALVGLGASPSIMGYSSVATAEEGYARKQEEGEMALKTAVEQEADSKQSCFPDHIVTPEESSLVYHKVEEEDTDHGFVEAISKDENERKSLVSGRNWEEIENEDEQQNGRA